LASRLKSARTHLTVLPTPRGKDEVITAVIRAAQGHFSSRPIRDVSLREVAKDAHVNLGLIHRHIGSKRDLLRAVLDYSAKRYRAIIRSSSDPNRALIECFGQSEFRKHLQTVAFLALSNESFEDLVPRDGGGMLALLEAQRALGRHADGTETVAAMSLLMGWMLFKSFLIEALRAKIDSSKLESDILVLAEEIWSGRLCPIRGNGTSRRLDAPANMQAVRKPRRPRSKLVSRDYTKTVGSAR
jgi:TetR/AcrR family transcriptional regulator, repressor for neighboring sulfatase